MNILSVSQQEYPGGAETSAYNLFLKYGELGHKSWLAVGTRKTCNPAVFEIPRCRWKDRWEHRCQDVSHHLRRRSPSLSRLFWLASTLARPVATVMKRMGAEDIYHPGTKHLLKLCPELPDIIHCHNLHSKYFDLRCLPWLCARTNLVLNFRDSWLLTGHCAAPAQCERWRIGCGNCPDLTIPVAIRRDRTAKNWLLKRRILAQSRFHATAPSKWQLQQVLDTLSPKSILSSRVIPNGIPIDVFQPEPQSVARQVLGLPEKATIISMTGQHAFRDLPTMTKALAGLVLPQAGAELIFLVLGRDGMIQQLGNGTLRFAGYIVEPEQMRHYYCASDIFIHASHAEAFGKAVTEAMACGIPVVATRTGGLPEQLVDGETGIVVDHGDSLAMRDAVQMLLAEPERRATMGRAGIAHVRENYTIAAQAKRFLDWFEEIRSTKQC